MKTAYEKLEMEVIRFEAEEDIITTSADTDQTPSPYNTGDDTGGSGESGETSTIPTEPVGTHHFYTYDTSNRVMFYDDAYNVWTDNGDGTYTYNFTISIIP